MSLLLGLKNLGTYSQGTLLTITRIILLGHQRIGHIHGSKQNEMLWVIGNGPSFRESWPDIEQKLLVPGNIFLGVNYMCLSETFSKIKPAYYVLSAPEFFWLKETEMKPEYVESRKKLFNSLCEKVCWPFTLMVPAQARKHSWWHNELKSNRFIKIMYYSHLPAEGFPVFQNFCFKAQLGMPRPHNVIIPSLMCGIWMGYKNIGLLGAEHSWLPTITVNDNNQVLLNHQHFYDDGAKVNVMTYEGRRTRKLHEVLEKFYFSFRSYWIIQSFAEKQGVKITNFTPNSYIDAFPKQKL